MVSGYLTRLALYLTLVVVILLIIFDTGPLEQISSLFWELWSGNCGLACLHNHRRVTSRIPRGLPNSKVTLQIAEATSANDTEMASAKNTEMAAALSKIPENGAVIEKNGNENCVCEICPCATIESVLTFMAPLIEVCDGILDTYFNSSFYETVREIYDDICNTVSLSCSTVGRKIKMDSQENFCLVRPAPVIVLSRKLDEDSPPKEIKISSQTNIFIPPPPVKLSPPPPTSSDASKPPRGQHKGWEADLGLSSTIHNLPYEDPPLPDPPPSILNIQDIENATAQAKPKDLPTELKPPLGTQEGWEAPVGLGVTIKEEPTVSDPLVEESSETSVKSKKKKTDAKKTNSQTNTILQTGPSESRHKYVCPKCKEKGSVCVNGCPNEPGSRKKRGK